MSPQPNQPKHLTTDEVCAELRICALTLARWRKARKITYIRMGGKFLYPRTALDAFLAKRTLVAA